MSKSKKNTKKSEEVELHSFTINTQAARKEKILVSVELLMELDADTYGSNLKDIETNMKYSETMSEWCHDAVQDSEGCRLLQSKVIMTKMKRGKEK